LPDLPGIGTALSSLKWLASHLGDTRVTFDLADLRGYAYYSGARFSIYAPGPVMRWCAAGAMTRWARCSGAIARRSVSAWMSRRWSRRWAARHLHAAIRAPWGEQEDLRRAVAGLRAEGHTVVCVLPGHESEVDEFQCDRELLQVAGQWVVQAI
jgi:ATP phosphoribosyltransferase regulatory subunit